MSNPQDEREALLPCPFCGGEAQIGTVPQDHEDAGGRFVCCTNSACAASSALIYPLMDDVESLLLARWNRRATLANQRAEAGARPGEGKELHDKLIRAIGGLITAKDQPSKWGSVGPDAEDIAWDEVRELVNYVCVRIDSPPAQPEAVPQNLSAEDAIDEALVVACISPRQRGEPWAKALARLLEWEVQTALDPRVSSAAADLLAQGRQEAVPQGGQWKMVPGEPTTAMINAGQCGCMDNDVTVAVWRDTLSAAPPSPQPLAAPEAVPQGEPLARYKLSIVANTGYEATTEGTCTPEQYGAAIGALEGASPQPPAAADFKGWYCSHCQRGVDASEVTYNEQHTECGRVITDDRPPQPPAAQAMAPLTDEQIERLRLDICNMHILGRLAAVKLVRAAEAAHGIGTAKPAQPKGGDK